MTNEQIKEEGITSTVTTNYSSITVKDILIEISQKKAKACIDWLETIDYEIKKPIIAGVYFTGVAFASQIEGNFEEIQILDIYEHLLEFIQFYYKEVPFKNPHIEFSNDLKLLQEGDLIVDTTGIGGLNEEDIKSLKNCKIFLCEDPSSDGTDSLLNEKNNIPNRLRLCNADFKGAIHTYGFNSKTSGTMTLTINLLREAMNKANSIDGVLYSTSNINFYEKILFKEKDVEKFVEFIDKPALVVSSIVPVDVDEILLNLLNLVYAKIKEY